MVGAWRKSLTIRFWKGLELHLLWLESQETEFTREMTQLQPFLSPIYSAQDPKPQDRDSDRLMLGDVPTPRPGEGGPSWLALGLTCEGEGKEKVSEWSHSGVSDSLLTSGL